MGSPELGASAAITMEVEEDAGIVVAMIADEGARLVVVAALVVVAVVIVIVVLVVEAVVAVEEVRA